MRLQGERKMQTMGRWTPEIIIYTDLDCSISGLECATVEEAREKIAAYRTVFGNIQIGIYQKVEG